MIDSNGGHWEGVMEDLKRWVGSIKKEQIISTHNNLEGCPGNSADCKEPILEGT